MSRYGLTSHRTRITLVAALAAITLAACSSGDDDEPTDPSLLRAVDDALCKGAKDPKPGSAYETIDGTVYLRIGGELYDMSDCP